jgi:hypothetical protein
MKFYQGFLGILLFSIGLIYAALSIFIHFVVNALMMAAGILLLALNAFAFLVWFVNWRYYPDS